MFYEYIVQYSYSIRNYCELKRENKLMSNFFSYLQLSTFLSCHVSGVIHLILNLSAFFFSDNIFKSYLLLFVFP